MDQLISAAGAFSSPPAARGITSKWREATAFSPCRRNYVSGAALSDSATWNNSTISSLGLTPGTYTWAWGGGDHADSFVINIKAPAPAVPEPASLALLATAVLGLGTAGRLTRR